MRLLGLIVLIFTSWNIYASDCSAPLTTFRPILYSVEKDGIKSYLVGVFHQTVDATNLPDSIKRAIDAADTLVNEVDPNEPFPMEQLFFADGTTLASQISEKTLNKVHELFPGLPENTRPVLPYVQYMEGLAKSAVGQADTTAELMDASLRNYAAQVGKGISFLDTQGDVVSRYVVGVTPELLDWTLLVLDPARFAKSFQDQRAAFQAGDLDEHAKLYFQAHIDTQSLSLFRTLIVSRNQKWLPQILTLHSQGPAFFAVGVGHLPGNHGLIKMLEQEKFTVTRE